MQLLASNLSSAVFSRDGSFVTVSFSAPTDRGGTASTFQCNLLFVFLCVESAVCRWENAYTVSGFFFNSISSACAVPGDTIAIAPGAAIRAFCDITVRNCSSVHKWATVAIPSSVVIQTPDYSSSFAVVAISSPSTVRDCDDLVIDAMSSYGSGGRSWRNMSVLVESSNYNISALRSFVETKYQLSPPTAIPSRLLAAGYSDTFILELCNFVGNCATGSYFVVVLSTAISTVSIPGNRLRSVVRMSPISLSSLAYLTDCSGGIVGMEL